MENSETKTMAPVPVEATSPPKKARTFKDSFGVEWHPVLTTPAIIAITRRYNIRIIDLVRMNLNIGDMLESIWFLCEAEAKAREIKTPEEFIPRLPIQSIPEIFECVTGTFEDAFPGKGDFDKAGIPFGQMVKELLGVTG